MSAQTVELLEMLADQQANSAYAVTPHDTNDLSILGSKIFVGTGGDIKVDMHKTGTATLFKNIPDGTFLPLMVDKVYSTDTTASDIVAVYRTRE